MTLDELSVGVAARIRGVTGAGLLRERLTELGFLTDDEIRIVRRAPLGDPVFVRIRGGSFALRRSEARCVSVDLPTRAGDRDE